MFAFSLYFSDNWTFLVLVVASLICHFQNRVMHPAFDKRGDHELFLVIFGLRVCSSFIISFPRISSSSLKFSFVTVLCSLILSSLL